MILFSKKGTLNLMKIHSYKSNFKIFNKHLTVRFVLVGQQSHFLIDSKELM